MYTQRKIDAILCFLNNYIVFEHEETQRLFEEELDKITGQKNTMRNIEWLAEKRVKEVADSKMEGFIKRLLTGTELSVEKIAILSETSVDTVEKVRESLHS